MAGFEPQTSGVGSDNSNYWATTTAQMTSFLQVKIDAVELRSKLIPLNAYLRYR